MGMSVWMVVNDGMLSASDNASKFNLLSVCYTCHEMLTQKHQQ